MAMNGIQSVGRPELLAQAQDKPGKLSGDKEVILRQNENVDQRIRVYFENGEVVKIEDIWSALIPEGPIAGQYKHISRYLPREKRLEGDSNVWARDPQMPLTGIRYGGPKKVPLTNKEKLEFVEHMEQAIKVCKDPVVRTALKRTIGEIKGNRLSTLLQDALKKIRK